MYETPAKRTEGRNPSYGIENEEIIIDSLRPIQKLETINKTNLSMQIISKILNK